MTLVLLTNVILSGRSGTEVATVELAQALRRRGHRAAIFSPTLGPLAHSARTLGIAVTNRIDTVGFTPDVIHGSHNAALALAMVRFPHTPAVFICHDSASPLDEPVRDEHIGLYVAVDAACRDRLIMDGVDAAEIVVIANAVDLQRFTLRHAWSARPRSALLIVKQSTAHVALVTEACRSAGVTLDVVGPGVGNVVDDLADRCRKADIVFAHSRGAIEAAAVGAAVIVIDEFGYGGRFGRDQVVSWPDTPLSHRILAPLPSSEELSEAILAYDAAECQETALLLRRRVDLDILVADWEAAYARAIECVARRATQRDGAGLPTTGSVAGFLARYIPRVDQSTELEDAAERLLRHERMLQRYVDLLQNLNTGSPATILFHPGALGHVLLGDGWHQPESWGVWSASEHAAVWLPETVLAAWKYRFEVSCSRYMPPDLDAAEARVVDVYVGGTLLTKWRFTPDQPSGPKRKLVVIPAHRRPEPGRSMLLTFRIEQPASPADTGESKDRRTLGVRLTSIEGAQ